MKLLDALSLTGSIVLILALLTFSGIVMQAFGIEAGEKIWQNFGTALTTFISGKSLGKAEERHAREENTSNKEKTN